MKMKPLLFTISSPVTFHNVGSDQTITFNPEANVLRFHWQGANKDKIGTCQIVHEQGLLYLEFSLNYAREERYLVTILDMEDDMVSAFTLKARPGGVMEFRK
jgi:hypothetical protein